MPTMPPDNAFNSDNNKRGVFSQLRRAAPGSELRGQVRALGLGLALMHNISESSAGATAHGQVR